MSKFIKDSLKVSGIPILIASLCCLAPIVLVAAGISTVAFGISLTNFLDGQFRWAFQLTGILALVASLFVYFRKRGICTLDQAKRHRNEIINKTIIVILVSAIGYFLFFNIFLTLIGRQLRLWN